MILAFIFGVLWMLGVGVQVRLFANPHSPSLLFAWTVGSSLLWCALVRKITLEKSSIWTYALGTGVGAILALYIQ